MDDLISRAAAIETIVSLTAFENEDELKKFVEEKACDDYYLGGICDAIDEIKDTAAVDAVPVVHVQWVDIPNYPQWDQKMCSACGNYFCCQNSYCPNCGAKMDGERRDDDGSAD